MTLGRNARFEVQGSVADGARIWMGARRTTLPFSADFFRRLLAHFSGKTVRTGTKFDDAGTESLGSWIQANLPTKMNPAVYIGGLLIDEGYADYPKRGWIRFFDERQDAPTPSGGESKQRLLRLARAANEAEAAHMLARLESSAREGDDVLGEAFRDDPIFVPPRQPRSAHPVRPRVRLEGTPLSEDIVKSRR